MKKSLKPVIKWTGSKQRIASRIAALFPNCTGCYFEPFVGGGALLPFSSGHQAIAGDSIAELINLWVCIRDKPEQTAQEYEIRWKKLQFEGHKAYYTIRNSFNNTRNPYDLLFLTRTCVNGLIRFNQNNQFNNSFHHNRPGIAPEKLQKIIKQWSNAIKQVDFLAKDYRNTLNDVNKGDFVFLDPPYGGTKGRYKPNTFDLDDFYHELYRLNTLGVYWILTFDGTSGNRSYKTTIPSTLYTVRVKIPTGNAPFTKLMNLGIDTVEESIYMNFNPSVQALHNLENVRQKKFTQNSSFDVQQSRLLL